MHLLGTPVCSDWWDIHGWMDEWVEISVRCCGVLCVSGVVELKILFFYFRAGDVVVPVPKINANLI